MYYDDATPGGARIGLSSVLLLIIFVSAFALIVAATLTRPWSDDGSPAVSNPPAGQQAGAESDADSLVPVVNVQVEDAAPADAAAAP